MGRVVVQLLEVGGGTFYAQGLMLAPMIPFRVMKGRTLIIYPDIGIFMERGPTPSGPNPDCPSENIPPRPTHIMFKIRTMGCGFRCRVQ